MDPSPTDPDALLCALAAGVDADAWQALVTTCGAEMLRAAQAVTGDAQRADDAVQEAFLQVRDHAGLYRSMGADPAAGARAWLRRVAATCALQLLRAERRRARHERKAEESIMREPSPAPDEACASNEQRRHVMAALAELPERQREPIVLHVLAGLPHQEMADRLGCTVGTARVRLHRALELLRQRLGPSVGPIVGTGLVALLMPRTLSAVEAPQLAAWQDLLRSGRRPRLPPSTIFGSGGSWLKASLLLATLVCGLFAWLWMTMEPERQPSPPVVVQAAVEFPPPAVIPPAFPLDDAVSRSLASTPRLFLQRDTLHEALACIDVQLPPDVRIRWRVPGGLQRSRVLLSGTWQGRPLRDILDDWAKQHALRWQRVADGIVLWQPGRVGWAKPPLPERQAELRLAGADLDDRRDLLLALREHPRPAYLAPALLRLGREGVAALWSGDAELAPLVARWLAENPQAQDEPAAWRLWLDLACDPASAQTALDQSLAAGADGRRRAVHAAQALALRLPVDRLEVLVDRICATSDLDLAIAALGSAGRRGSPAALKALRPLAAGVVPAVWKPREAGPAILAMLRHRPQLDYDVDWWKEDARVRLSEPAFPIDPLYREPALRVLAARGDAVTLAQLADWLAPGQDGVRAGLAALILAEAGRAVPDETLDRLVQGTACWDGLGGQVLRLLPPDRVPAQAWFDLAKSVGGSHEDGAITDFRPWLRILHGRDDPRLIALIGAQLDLDSFEQLRAAGNGCLTWGFSIYSRLVQTLAVMGTPAALSALRSHPPRWKERTDVAWLFYSWALAQARDAESLALLRAAVEPGGRFRLQALAALPLARDVNLLTQVSAGLGKQKTSPTDRYYRLIMLAQAASEWAPAALTLVPVATTMLQDPEPELRRIAASQLGSLPTLLFTGGNETLAAAEAAAEALLTWCSDGKVDAQERRTGAEALLMPGWPSAAAARIAARREELQRLLGPDAGGDKSGF